MNLRTVIEDRLLEGREFVYGLYVRDTGSLFGDLVVDVMSFVLYRCGAGYHVGTEQVSLVPRR